MFNSGLLIILLNGIHYLNESVYRIWKVNSNKTFIIQAIRFWKKNWKKIKRMVQNYRRQMKWTMYLLLLPLWRHKSPLWFRGTRKWMAFILIFKPINIILEYKLISMLHLCTINIWRNKKKSFNCKRAIYLHESG